MYVNQLVYNLQFLTVKLFGNCYGQQELSIHFLDWLQLFETSTNPSGGPTYFLKLPVALILMKVSNVKTIGSLTQMLEVNDRSK